MYSILFSKINEVDQKDILKIKPYIKIQKLAVFPWTFADCKMPNLVEDFFRTGGKHYEKYINQMQYLGISRDNIISINPFQTSRTEITEILNSYDGIFIPGGNPEMFMTIAIKLNVVDLFTNYTGIIIGESAGSVLQFEIYGLPVQNNYYNCNSFYNGFGAIKCNYSLDVHTQNNYEYINNVQILSNFKKINIYTLSNNACLIINRQTEEQIKIGDINMVSPIN